MALDLNLDNLQKIHVFHRFFCDFPPFSSYFRNNLRGSRVFRCFEAHDESCSIRSAWRLPENTKANSKSTSCLAGGFNDLHPYLGKIPMFTNMFQLGWNHQLVVYTIFNHMFVWSLSQEHMSFPSIFFPTLTELSGVENATASRSLNAFSWGAFSPGNSRHQDYYMFSRGSL